MSLLVSAGVPGGWGARDKKQVFHDWIFDKKGFDPYMAPLFDINAELTDG